MSRRALIAGGGLLGLGVVGADVMAVPDRPNPDLASAPGLPSWLPTDPADLAAQEVGHRDPYDSNWAAGKEPGQQVDGKSGTKLRTFASTDLTVPVVAGHRRGPVAPGLLLVGQKTDDYHGAILEDSGEPVWIEPTGATVTDLRVQRYRGAPVLTYWTGSIVSGHGYGEGRILDSTYRTIATVRTAGGIEADLHEFNLTDAGTALMTSYPTVRADLRAVDGPRRGYIYDCRAQEIDIATGRVLLDWSALDHIGIDETYKVPADEDKHDGTSPDRAFDPYHLNAIDDDGDRLLLSCRHTHAVYCIGRANGAMRWRLGGKRSDFHVPRRAAFAWQHDIRCHGGGVITLFDNHYIDSDKGEHSRGLRLRLDEAARTVALVTEYRSHGYLATAMGDTQLLPNGHALVGWGTSPHATEFDADGNIVYEADLGGITYRAFRHEWAGRPRTRPAIAAERRGDAVRVAVSWNGATEVARWEIRAGHSWFGLRTVVGVPRSGFETQVRIAPATVVAADALDAAGNVLGRTGAVAV